MSRPGHGGSSPGRRGPGIRVLGASAACGREPSTPGSTHGGAPAVRLLRGSGGFSAGMNRGAGGSGIWGRAGVGATRCGRVGDGSSRGGIPAGGATTGLPVVGPGGSVPPRRSPQPALAGRRSALALAGRRPAVALAGRRWLWLWPIRCSGRPVGSGSGRSGGSAGRRSALAGGGGCGSGRSAVGSGRSAVGSGRRGRLWLWRAAALAGRRPGRRRSALARRSAALWPVRGRLVRDRFTFCLVKERLVQDLIVPGRPVQHRPVRHRRQAPARSGRPQARWQRFSARRWFLCRGRR